MEFVAAVDDKGKPTGGFEPACYPCGDCALRLRPDMKISVLVAVFRNERGAGQNDPTFHSDFVAGKQIYDSLQDVEPTVPLLKFNPTSEVNKTSSYGYRVKQSFGLLTDAEFAALVEEWLMFKLRFRFRLRLRVNEPRANGWANGWANSFRLAGNVIGWWSKCIFNARIYFTDTQLYTWAD